MAKTLAVMTGPKGGSRHALPKIWIGTSLRTARTKALKLSGTRSLYTIWTKGSVREQAFAVVYCTLGDLLIAVSTLSLALVLAGDRDWPQGRFWPVAILTIAFGVGYTAFSEWLNVVVRASRAYSDWMPAITVLDQQIGHSPLL
jgi:hypothetical protein